MIAIGVDGCRAGWFGVKIDRADRWDAAIFPNLATLYAAWQDGDALFLIDVPIGLPDSTSYRICDAEARAYLGPKKASSVFNPPTRAVMDATRWEEAAKANEHACGKRISKQTWAIVPKIKEVDEFLVGDLQRQIFVREVHPEVLFQVLNQGRSVASKKKSLDGRLERLEILERHIAGCREFFEESSTHYPRSDLHPDDILDAMSAAVVAYKYSDQLRTMPANPPTDSAGIRCEMVVPSIRELPPKAFVTVEMRSDTGKLLYRGVIDQAAFERVRAQVEAEAK